MSCLIMVGACYIDTILRHAIDLITILTLSKNPTDRNKPIFSVDHYPDEDEKLRASSLNRRRGGNCPNSLEVIQQLVNFSQSRLFLSLISVLPERESASAKFIRQTLGPKINCDCCIYRQNSVEAASAFIIKSETSGSRTIVNHNDLSEMTIDEFKSSVDSLEPIRNPCFHFEGRIPEVTLQSILYIRQRHPSALISVEVENPRRPGLEQLASEADFVFYAKGWAQARGYSSMKECLISQANNTPKAKYLFCTWGKKGAAMLHRQDNTCISLPALEIPDTDIVDSTGAGDTFTAGMLFGLLCHPHDWNQERKLQFAIELAGLKVRQNGFQGLEDSGLVKSIVTEKSAEGF